MPKNKGIRLTPPIIKAVRRVDGIAEITSLISTGFSNKYKCGLTKRINKLITNVAITILIKQNRKTIDSLACINFFFVKDK